MAAAATDSEVRQAVLHSVKSGLYPESEGIATADLQPAVLPALTDELRKARDDIENHVRTISKDSGADIDTWIAQAKQVQADIERSKLTAREIVQQAEAHHVLKDATTDAGYKVGLLEKEVVFNESLTSILEDIRSASGIVSKAKEDVVHSRIESALGKVLDGEAAIVRLQRASSTKAYELLNRRLGQVKLSLGEETITLAAKLIQINEAGMSVQVSRSIPNKPEVTLESVPQVLSKLDSTHPWLESLRRRLGRSLFEPLLQTHTNRSYRIKSQTDRLWIETTTSAPNTMNLLDDIALLVSFLAEHLPSSIYKLLAHKVMPGFLESLESSRLHASVPLSTDGMHDFEKILERVNKLAAQMDQLEWEGGSQLRSWVEGAPRVWLSRRREHALGSTRQLLFSGLRDRKTVERVETQVIASDDTSMGISEPNNDGDDAWGDEWAEDETGPHAEPAKSSAAHNDEEEDEDASAWGADFGDEEPSSIEHHAPEGQEANDDDEAWGWGDDEQAAQSNKNINGNNANATNGALASSATNGHSKPQEITLRETYTVTSVPEGVLEIILQIFEDAKTLSDPSFAQTPIVPAVTALFGLPTLILAMYRGTASTSYSRIENGNMLIYNDSLRLSDQIHSVCEGKHTRSDSIQLQASATRKLENDLKALDIFAKRAYGAEMDAQRTVLRDLLDGAQGFGSCTEAPFASECDNAVAMTIDRIQEVYRQWKPILSQSALLQSVGSLLSTATSKVIMDIKDLSDIGEEESKTLRSYCTSFSTLHELFVQQHPGSNEVRDMTGLYCANWLKFQYLAEILDANLADIKYLWTEGELSLEFQAEEIVDLIEALFADSDHRRRAIAEIRRSGR